jgi:hypothetical protein
MSDPVRFSAMLAVRCQPEVLDALAVAAVAKLEKPSEYVRRAIIERLEADGALKLAVTAT